MWNAELLNVVSKGALAERPGSLGRLAALRTITESQFFTPLELAKELWGAVQSNAKPNQRYSALDNSVGSGRLLSFAEPQQWTLYGIDTDKHLIAKSQDLLSKSGFAYEFCAGSIADVTRMPLVSVAIINPPFSITLSSPYMKPYADVTSYGKFGPDTTALSHEYALAQACDSADAVLAIVPAALADRVKSGLFSSTHNLIADLRLATDTFKAENVKAVSTRLLVLSRQTNTTTLTGDYSPELLASLKFEFRTNSELKEVGNKSGIEFGGHQQSEPVITLPATGSKKVRLYQKRGMIGLRFECGLMQALCTNAVLRQKLKSDHLHRYPHHIKYQGHGTLNINAHLMNECPMESVERHLVAVLKQVDGAQIEIDPQLVNYMNRRAKQERIASTPFRKFIRRPGQSKAVITKNGLANPKDFKSPIIRNGQQFALVAGEKTEYALQLESGQYDVELGYLKQMANVTIGKLEQWQLLHEGRLSAFPQLAAQAKAKANQLGLSRWLWDFQLNDVLELSLGHKGSSFSADMGLGKSRMALALCLVGGQRNLIVVKSKLVSEMLREAKKVGLDDDILLITPKNINDKLKKINLVSYETLRKQLSVRGQSVTVASLFRHKLHSVICDEGSLLGSSSQRTLAIHQLRAKKVFATDGIIVDNYPRNLLRIAALVAGESVPSQPYSIHREKLEAWQAKGSKHTMRGADAFAERFVTLEWSVNEFRDSLEHGAKREVPKIKDVPAFRSWAELFVKRRVRQEPEVSAFIKIAEARYNAPEIIPWDQAHWAHYYEVATQFSAWFLDHRRKQQDNNKGLNLVAVLAEIEAVNRAANAPHVRNANNESAWKKTYSPLTSKQRWVIRKTKQLVRAGRKPLVFAQSPDVLQRLFNELSAEGLKPMLFTGKQTISQRNLELNKFREDNSCVDVLLASYGTATDGLNIPQCTDIVLYSGSWSFRTISQAVARLLRPEQTSQVEVHQCHLAGSIDEYQYQIQAFKKNAMSAGIDYQEQTEGEFLHLDHIFYQFVEDLKTKEAA